MRFTVLAGLMVAAFQAQAGEQKPQAATIVIAPKQQAPSVVVAKPPSIGVKESSSKGPIVISAIPCTTPVVLKVADPYHCREVDVTVQVPTASVTCALAGAGVGIATHHHLFHTTTGFNFSGHKVEVKVYKNGKVAVN